MAKRIFVAGRPNSGKGSVGDQLCKKYAHRGFQLYSSGEKLRWHVSQKTEIGLKAKSYMDEGMLVPDDVIVEMAKNDLSVMDGIVWIDGVPRNLFQVEEFERKGIHPDVIILIDIPEAEAIARSVNRRCCPCGATYTVEGGYNPPKKRAGYCDKCGTELIIRKDDKPEVSQNRQMVYTQQTEPAIYRAMEIFGAKGCQCFVIDNITPGGFERVEAALISSGILSDDN